MKEIRVDLERSVSLEEAERYAKKIASEYGDFMLLSIYDNETKFKVPNVDCCGERSWEIYALSRGGNLKVKVNQFEFIFRVE